MSGSAQQLRPEIAQQQASDPAVSAWVAASAGTGKTKVLTDRVLRLMLAGTEPEKILCITFTKAAAAEMAIRINGTLGGWAVMEDGELGQALFDLTGERPDRETQDRAIQMYDQLGYVRWGTNPHYARVDDTWLAGHYYYKDLKNGT